MSVKQARSGKKRQRSPTPPPTLPAPSMLTLPTQLVLSLEGEAGQMYFRALSEHMSRRDIVAYCSTSHTVRTVCKAMGNRFWREKLQRDFPQLLFNDELKSIGANVEMVHKSDGRIASPTHYFYQYISAVSIRNTIAAGHDFSIALLDDGSVVGWGADEYGQATGGQALATNGRRFISISAGTTHSLGLLDDGSVVGWGNDNDGEATGGQALATNGRKFISISAGGSYSLGLLDDGSVVGWGSNDSHQVSDIQTLATGRHKFVAISAGRWGESLGLLDDGSVVGWGSYFYSRHGRGRVHVEEYRSHKFIAITIGDEYALGILQNGRVFGWGIDKYNQATGGKRLSLDRKYIAISAGRYHSLGLLDDGTVVGWGGDGGKAKRATGGQELATNGRKFVAIAAGVDHSLGLLNDGSIVGWGSRKATAGQALARRAGRKFMLPN